MVSRQELKIRLEKLLERTGIFAHVNVQGDLDIEGNSLIIEYTQNPKTEKNFREAREILKSRIKNLIGQKYSLGISAEFRERDRTNRYKDVFTRMPIEGICENPTLEFLKDYVGLIGDKYLFED